MSYDPKRARGRKPHPMLGHKIFPTDEFVSTISVPIAKADIEAFAQEIGLPDLAKAVTPAVVGCVVYSSTFNDENHVTEIVAAFGKRDPANSKIIRPISTEDGETPLDMLKIQLMFGSGKAD